MTATEVHEFVKLPSRVRAIRYDGTNFDIIADLAKGTNAVLSGVDGNPPLVYDIHSRHWMEIYVGAWIVRGNSGHVYGVDDGEFRKRFSDNIKLWEGIV